MPMRNNQPLAWRRKVADITSTPKAKALREAIDKAVNDYRFYLEEAAGCEVFVSLGAKDTSPDPKNIVQWDEIKRPVH
jgi:hypothetical protein